MSNPKKKELKLSKAQNKFFDFIEAGEHVNVKTRKAAKVGQTWISILKELDWVEGPRNKAKYIGPTPIPRIYLKQLFVQKLKGVYSKHAPDTLKAANETVIDAPPLAYLDEIHEHKVIQGTGENGRQGLLIPADTMPPRKRAPRTPLARYSVAELLNELKRLGYTEIIKQTTNEVVLSDYRTEHITKKIIIKL